MNRRKFGKATRPPRIEGDILFGRHVLAAWLDTMPGRLQKLFVDGERAARHADLIAQAGRHCVPVETVSRAVLDRMLPGADRHQGIAARCSPFPYSDAATIFAARPNLILCLDRLHDPQNLGAILRTAAAVGTGGVFLPKDNAVGISPSVEAAAVGATALLPVAKVTNVARSLDEAKSAGFWIAALAATAKSSLYDLELPRPLVLVAGGEAGLRPLVQSSADFQVSIPMSPKVESLNVSVAVAVALFEIHRRWLDTKKLVM